MSDEKGTAAPQHERMDVREAQDMIAAAIPEIEKLAWRLFAIARDLEAAEGEEDFADQEPGPEHLRYATAAGAMAVYSEMLELLPYLRKTAEKNDGDLREEWQRQQDLPAEARHRDPLHLREEIGATKELLREVVRLLVKASEQQQKGAEP